MKDSTLQSLSSEDTFDLIGKQWMLGTAGTKDSFNTMTASWGGLGWLWNKPVAFVFIRPERYTHDFIESSDRMTLSFFSEAYRKALQFCGTRSGRKVNKIEATGLDGNRQIYEFRDFDARVMCHESDHLDGILFTDKATNIRPAAEEYYDDYEDEEE